MPAVDGTAGGVCGMCVAAKALNLPRDRTDTLNPTSEVLDLIEPHLVGAQAVLLPQPPRFPLGPLTLLLLVRDLHQTLTSAFLDASRCLNTHTELVTLRWQSINLEKPTDTTRKAS